MTAVESLIGVSAAMDELKAVIARAARMKWSILIQGETGTGKDLVAQAIHFLSDRSHGPFVPVNCAGLSEELFVSELFGHERGSFTGAFAQQKGKFELAAGGTLFLDEIGELSLPTQAKLLRALQDHKIDRLGGRHPIVVDVRVIAATNRELDEAVRAGVFREDLLFRLKSLTIRTPPLRERSEDILVLARYFLTRYSKEGGGVVCEISPETESILEKHDWPGNVRELQNAMQHVVAFADHEVARPEDLPELRPSPHRTPEDSSFRKTLDETKRHLLEDAVIRTAGNYKEAALRLGLNPKSIHRYLKTYNLSHLLR